MLSIANAFAPSYAQARVKFLEGAAQAGLRIASFAHALPGAQDEALAMDIAWDGPPDAERLVMISSGCHGAEGFCGSGVQVFALHDQQWRDHAQAANVAVLYVHALDPVGFSHLHRLMHEDEAADQQCLPAFTPNVPENGSRPNGLLLDGHVPAWSEMSLRSVLQQYAAHCQHLAWIDVHNSAQPTGLGKRIFIGPNHAATYDRACRWWGQRSGSPADAPLQRLVDEFAGPEALSGLVWHSAFAAAPQAQWTTMALRFGAVPTSRVLAALGNEDGWKGQVISQARQALFQAVDGLSA